MTGNVSKKRDNGYIGFVEEKIKGILDIAPFNAATNDVYKNFIEKYQLRQNEWIDLSFVGNPAYYASLSDAVSDINDGVRAEDGFFEDAEAVTFFDGEVTVLRLLKNVELSSTMIFTKSVIFDLYGHTISNNASFTEDMFISNTANTDSTFVMYDNKGGSIKLNFNAAKVDGKSTGLRQGVRAANKFTGLYGINIYGQAIDGNTSTDVLVYLTGCKCAEVYNCKLEISRILKCDSTEKADILTTFAGSEAYKNNAYVKCIVAYDTNLQIDNSIFNIESSILAIAIHLWKQDDQECIITVKNSNFFTNAFLGNTQCIYIDTDSIPGRQYVNRHIYEFENIKATSLHGNKIRYIQENDVIREEYQDMAIAIVAYADCELRVNSSEVHGCHSGLEANNATVYIHDSLLEAPSHGGVYASDNSIVFITDSTLRRLPAPYEEFVINGWASAYFAYGATAYIDGCVFKDSQFAVKCGAIISKNSNGEYITKYGDAANVYISNSIVGEKQDGTISNTARIDDTCFLFCGEGMNEISNSSNSPGTIVQDNATSKYNYRIIAKDIPKTSDEILNTQRLKDTFASNIAYDIFIKSGLAEKEHMKSMIEFFKSVLEGGKSVTDILAMFGDIDSALDSILAIENSLIGGEGA